MSDSLPSIPDILNPNPFKSVPAVPKAIGGVGGVVNPTHPSVPSGGTTTPGQTGTPYRDPAPEAPPTGAPIPDENKGNPLQDAPGPPPPPTPTDITVSTAMNTAATDQRRVAAGRASTYLTGGRGLLSGPQTARRTLLGS